MAEKKGGKTPPKWRILRQFRAVFAAVLALILAINLYLLAAPLVGVPYPTVFGWSRAIVLSGSMEPTFAAGDLLLFRTETDYEVGDIVIFSHENTMVTHRIVAEEGGKFVTKGDANNTNDGDLLETENIYGKMRCILPNVGDALLFLRTPLGTLILAVAALALWEAPHVADHLKRKQVQRDET